jgi:hypothetical protein
VRSIRLRENFNLRSVEEVEEKPSWEFLSLSPEE